jgi:hypothetical protein
MRVTIHQPNYIPWIGFFCKMSLGDVFVSFDSVELPNNGIVHRNKIRTKEGWDWVTIPIERKKIGLPIKDVRLPDDKSWWKKHWVAFIANYSKAAYFSEYKPFFEELYRNRNQNSLQELNESVIIYIAHSFGISPRFVRASELELDFSLHKTDFILDILKNVGCTQYFSGAGGAKTFLEEDKIKNSNIDLWYSQITPVEYPQRWPGFEPYMSALDLLFNLGGEKGREIIDQMHNEYKAADEN